MVKYYIVSMRYVNSIVAMCHCSTRSQFNYYIVSMRYFNAIVILYNCSHCIIVRRYVSLRITLYQCGMSVQL